jgi:hypothetical protein
MVRLVNPTPHKPVIYPSIVLPKMTTVPLQPTIAPVRGPSAPMIPANKGPAIRPPQVK